MADGFTLTSDGYSIDKDPQAVLDYTINWTAWLDSDTISAVAWSADSGITVDSSSFTDTSATVWLSEGVLGSEYVVTCHVTTAGGREDDRSFKVIIVNK